MEAWGHAVSGGEGHSLCKPAVFTCGNQRSILLVLWVACPGSCCFLLSMHAVSSSMQRAITACICADLGPVRMTVSPQGVLGGPGMRAYLDSGDDSLVKIDTPMGLAWLDSIGLLFVDRCGAPTLR